MARRSRSCDSHHQRSPCWLRTVDARPALRQSWVPLEEAIDQPSAWAFGSVPRKNSTVAADCNNRLNQVSFAHVQLPLSSPIQVVFKVVFFLWCQDNTWTDPAVHAYSPVEAHLDRSNRYPKCVRTKHRGSPSPCCVLLQTT